ncbi:MAG: FG-GAP-like repeat-containing protein, partial [Anaerolineae bacterium]
MRLTFITLSLLLIGYGIFSAIDTSANTTFSQSDQTVGFGDTEALLVGDFNQDSYPDLVMINRGVTGDQVWLNTGDGGFSQSAQTLPMHNASGFGLGGDVGDINGDEILDFVAIGRNVNYLALSMGDGTFTIQMLPEDLMASEQSAALGDLDDDGDLDLFIITTEANQVWFNDGTGTFSDSGQALGAFWSNEVELGDLDGDGDLDAATANGITNNWPSKIWINDGNGVFSEGATTNSGWAEGLTLADFDGDNDLDIFFSNYGQPNTVWVNDGSGGFSDSGQQLDNQFSLGAGAADVDADGDQDVIVAAGTDDSLLLLNDGAGNFSINAQTFPAPSSSTTAAVLDDFDRDGDVDVAFSNLGFNRLWFNEGAAPPEPTPLPTRVANPLIDRVSIASDGTEGDAWSSDPAISADGAYITFSSSSKNLIVNDRNRRSDIFIHNRITGVTERISISSSGSEANGASFRPDISADGRYVVFQSDATNLVEGDDNDAVDIFLHDRQSGTTQLVSVNSNGDTGNGDSKRPAISADGSTIVYESEATNLVIIDQNDLQDIFFYDTTNGTTTMASVASAGSQANQESWGADVSDDGNFIAFASEATNLVAGEVDDTSDIYVRDRRGFITRVVSIPDSGTPVRNSSREGSISDSGDRVAFGANFDTLVPEDTNEKADIFTHIISSGDTERRSTASDGSQADSLSQSPAISGDGLSVAFVSYADNLDGSAVEVRDVFLRDLQTDSLLRVSVNMAGGNSYSASEYPVVSADGRYVAFESYGPLILSDTNQKGDIYVYDRLGSVEPVNFP